MTTAWWKLLTVLEQASIGLRDHETSLAATFSMAFMHNKWESTGRGALWSSSSSSIAILLLVCTITLRISKFNIPSLIRRQIKAR